VDFNEEPAQKGYQLYKKELHLYLDKRDNCPEGFIDKSRTVYGIRVSRGQKLFNSVRNKQPVFVILHL
jgi:hypothetical protein